MPNVNAFRAVIHKKKMFKGFCYINLFLKICPLWAWPFVTPETLFEQN